MTQAAQLAQYGSNNVGLSFKNRIINGDMTIDQRNAGASVTPTTANNVFSVDRWLCNASQSTKYTVQQNAGSVTPPVGFTNYMGVTSSSAYSITSSDYFFLEQDIEGLNCGDLAWGTANAQTVTLSFWIRSSLTGTFGASLRNQSGGRSYPFSYTVNAANTWEQKSVTIAGDTSGTWLTTNGIGIRLSFSIGSGSNWAGTAGAWNSDNDWTVSGAVSVVGTSGATWQITGVQLEKGSVATSFDYLPYGTELMLCQRYCYKLMPGIQLSKMRELDRIRQGFFIMPVQMRTTVTVGAMATTDGIPVIIDNLSDRGFSMYMLATGDGMGAGINTQALVTAEL
jgi:hypothetical protein